jgi:cytochrome c
MTLPLAARLALAGAATLFLALGGCGRPQPPGAPPASEQQTAQPAPAPQALTDAQKKSLLAELPATYQNADLSNGEAKFALCRSCHSVAQGGEDMVGPNLWAIFGRKAGSKPGFSYSDSMKNAGWTWDADRLDKWIDNPRAVLPDTKMTFIGLPSPTDRRDVIAYLKVATNPPPGAS